MRASPRGNLYFFLSSFFACVFIVFVASFTFLFLKKKRKKKPSYDDSQGNKDQLGDMVVYTGGFFCGKMLLTDDLRNVLTPVLGSLSYLPLTPSLMTDHFIYVGHLLGSVVVFGSLTRETLSL